MILAVGKRLTDVSAHLDAATAAIFAGVACVALFFALRPELWRRLWFTKIDPRPAALCRVAFGAVVLWSLVDLLPYARMLFTDEGIWPTTLARKRFAGHMATAWDPEHGFASGVELVRAVWGRFSLFHLRSDPPFVFAIYGLTIAAVVALIAGWRTRLATIAAWLLLNTIYSYSAIFYTGGDTVIRVFLFLGIFLRWGDAYSVDAWRRRRRALLGGARSLPAPPLIPAWPAQLMILQLTIIYCATGALKSGLTWLDGTALYYALSLDHFYRHPDQIALGVVLQRIGALPLLTWATKLWETLFPFAAIGLALQAFERERRGPDGARLWGDAGPLRRALSYACVAGFFALAAYVAALAAAYYYDASLSPWPSVDGQMMARLVQAAVLAAPALLVALYLGLRRWAPRAHAWLIDVGLDRRLWLGFGVAMHLGIDLLMNVGTFVQVMLAVYLIWLKGDDVDALWRWVGSRPLRPGEGDAPARVGLRGWLCAPLRRLRHRAPRPRYTIAYAPGDDAAIRRAALLRCWDLGGRLDFAADPSLPGGALRMRSPEGAALAPSAAGVALCRLLPGLWPLAPLTLVPGVRAGIAALSLAILRQRRALALAPAPPP
ncbi:MAG: HTTM domain-containing protein [Nannocystaceae bacterium]